MSSSSKGSKLIKVVGFLAIVGMIVAVVRLVLKGIRSAKSDPVDEHNGI